MELPPSRYRVIERGRRLEVIDMLAGRRPAYAAEARPQPWTETDPVERPEGDLSAFDPQRDMPAENIPVAPPPRRTGSMPQAAPDFLINAAGIAGSARDRDGRLLIKTARWYDSNGPRTIALGQAAERKLGAAMLLLLAIVVGGVAAGLLVGWLGIALAFVLISQAGRVRTIATSWLDRLAAASR